MLGQLLALLFLGFTAGSLLSQQIGRLAAQLSPTSHTVLYGRFSRDNG